MPDTVLFQNWEKHSPFLEHKQHITFVIFMVLSVQMPFYLYDTHFLRNLQYVNLINHIYSKFIYSSKHMVGFEYFFKIYYYYFLNFCAGSLLLHMQSFSNLSERGLLSSCSEQASHCSGFSSSGAWALGVQASVLQLSGSGT